jgi:antitoxin ParD1/3/4
MNISLTPELENAVKAKVASGLYNNASEIIREALRESLRRERENDWLQREAAIGFAQLDAGQMVRIKSKKQFIAAVRGEKVAEGVYWVGDRAMAEISKGAGRGDVLEIENVWPWVFASRGFRPFAQPPAAFFDPFRVSALGKPPALHL